MVGVGFTRSNETRQSQAGTEDPENSQIRLSDGTVIFRRGALAEGVQIDAAKYEMTSITGSAKYNGFSIDGEYYFRWVSKLEADGVLPVDDLFDHGFKLQTSAMVVDKTLQWYGFRLQDFWGIRRSLGGRHRAQLVRIQEPDLSLQFGIPVCGKFTSGLSELSHPGRGQWARIYAQCGIPLLIAMDMKTTLLKCLIPIIMLIFGMPGSELQAQEVPTAGFDTTSYHPLFIQSKNQRFKLNLGMYTQFRYNMNWRQNMPDTDSTKTFTRGYNLARTRIFLEGNFTDKFYYHTRININPSGNFEFFVAYLQWNLNKGKWIRMGRQFMALGLEDWMYPQDLASIEFSRFGFHFCHLEFLWVSIPPPGIRQIQVLGWSGQRRLWRATAISRSQRFGFNFYR